MIQSLIAVILIVLCLQTIIIVSLLRMALKFLHTVTVNQVQQTTGILSAIARLVRK